MNIQVDEGVKGRLIVSDGAREVDQVSEGNN